MVTFRRADVNAGICFTFACREAATDFGEGANVSSSRFAQYTPSLSELQQLGIITEEDITSAHEASFVGDKTLQTCDFLFDEHELARSDDIVTLVDRPSYPDSTELTWTSDSEDWLENISVDMSDCASVARDPEDVDSDIFYDAVEEPQYVWFELDSSNGDEELY